MDIIVTWKFNRLKQYPNALAYSAEGNDAVCSHIWQKQTEKL
jgi:hypothetical protein